MTRREANFPNMMLMKSPRRRMHLCNVVLAVVFIVSLAAILPEIFLDHLGHATETRQEDKSNGNINSETVKELPQTNGGFPSLIQFLLTYLEPQWYHIQHVSSAQIVGSLRRMPESSQKLAVSTLQQGSVQATDFRNRQSNERVQMVNISEATKAATLKGFANVGTAHKTSSGDAFTVQNDHKIFGLNSVTLSEATANDAGKNDVNKESYQLISADENKSQGSRRTFSVQQNVSTKSSGVQEDPLVLVPHPDIPFASADLPKLEAGSDWLGRPLLLTIEKDTHDLKDDQYNFLQQAVWSGGWNVSQLSQHSLTSLMFPWETQLYTESPLTDIKNTSDELHSKVEVLSSSDTYRVGDQINIKIDLYDGYGRPRKRGGDDVRVWLKDEVTSAGQVVIVTDMRNGSYLASAPLLFPGAPQLRVSITYPREIIRAVYYLRNVMKGMRLNVGGFVSELASEATICTPFPFSGGYKELCNLTSLNYNLSWYCGRPSNPVLKCSHWRLIRDIEFPSPLPVTKAEFEWFDSLAQGKRHHLRLINTTATKFNVFQGDVSVINTSVACNQRPLEDSWTETAPRGYLMQGLWTPIGCTVPYVDFNTINNCLRGKTLFMVGDSNLRHMLEMMVHFGLCTPTQQLIGKRNWHAPQLCINHQYKYFVRWRTHALPFHTNADHWAPNTNQQSVARSLDEIPASGSYIVLLHMYLHFTTHHYSVYIERIRSMREAVERLLERNPQVQVVIRGPHAAFKGWNPMLGGDHQARLYLDLLKDEFKHLYKKVLLLDFWELTVAAESQDFHPEGKVTQQMLRILFGHVCR